MSLSDDDVREILRLIDESDLDELRIDTPELQLHVRRAGATVKVASEDEEEGREGVPVEPAHGTPPVHAPAAAASELQAVESPLLGVFYRAPAPGAPPYVEVGAVVEPETVVCLIEVMKMMNSIVAGVSGTIVEVCARNADLVEHGQPLFRVEPR